MIGGFVLLAFRRIGASRLPLCRKILKKIGIFPIRRHYYEPLFDYRGCEKTLQSADRSLHGIDFRIEQQKKVLHCLKYGHEITAKLVEGVFKKIHQGHVTSFAGGDADILYQMIRYKKPRRFYEIGSGASTDIAKVALAMNCSEDSRYECDHICIDPFHPADKTKEAVTNFQVIEKRVEEVDISLFSDLVENDILFIDSSHIIRPGGDVLREYLEILPSLNAGVVVHIHDIFSPKHYLQRWMTEDVLFWNEQYILEAFLTQNSQWDVYLALNYLCKNSYQDLKRCSPLLREDSEPGSLWIESNT